MDWLRLIERVASEVEHRVDKVRRPLSRTLRPNRAVRVVAYRGYGTPDRIRVRGRVLYGRPPTPASAEDRWWLNLSNAYRRLESDEVAGARVRVHVAGTSLETVANDEGHFKVDVDPRETLPDDRIWHTGQIRLVAPEGPAAETMIAVPRNPRLGLISDLDDTVIETNVRKVVRMVAEVLFGNAHTRVPFAGVGAFYRALNGAQGRDNPVFYVSSSPWNLHDVIDEFLRLHRIPPGPMYLRDWGISRGKGIPRGHHGHKREAIDEILDTYPDLPFILVGDSGQQDPEIYRGVVRDRPGRILAVYIRSVVPDPARIAAIDRLATELARHSDTELVLVDDTVEAAHHACQRGWIAESDIDAVAEDRAREEPG